MKNKLKKSTNVFSGKIIDVYVDDVIINNIDTKREVVKKRSGVVIVPFDDEGNLYLVKQYRYPVNEYLIEFPAGIIDKGEGIIEAAIRELEEEIGYTAEIIIPLGFIYSSPGFSDEKIYMCAIKVDEFVGQDLDDEEDIEVLKMSFKEFERQYINRGLIDDSKTLSAYLKFSLSGVFNVVIN